VNQEQVDERGCIVVQHLFRLPLATGYAQAGYQALAEARSADG
jgi:hypothetical protein